MSFRNILHKFFNKGVFVIFWVLTIFCLFFLNWFVYSLIVSEVYFDWTDEWIELFNEWENFSWELTIQWAKSSEYKLNNFYLKKNEFILIWDDFLNIVNSWNWIWQQKFSITDTKSIDIKIQQNWTILDEFNVDENMVLFFDNKKSSIQKIINLWNILYTWNNIASNFNIKDWFIWNPLSWNLIFQNQQNTNPSEDNILSWSIEIENENWIECLSGLNLLNFSWDFFINDISNLYCWTWQIADIEDENILSWDINQWNISQNEQINENQNNIFTWNSETSSWSNIENNYCQNQNILFPKIIIQSWDIEIVEIFANQSFIYPEYIKLKFNKYFSWYIDVFWIWYWESSQKIFIESLSWENFYLLWNDVYIDKSQKYKIIENMNLSNNWETIKIIYDWIEIENVYYNVSGKKLSKLYEKKIDSQKIFSIDSNPSLKTKYINECNIFFEKFDVNLNNVWVSFVVSWENNLCAKSEFKTILKQNSKNENINNCSWTILLQSWTNFWNISILQDWYELCNKDFLIFNSYSSTNSTIQENQNNQSTIWIQDKPNICSYENYYNQLDIFSWWQILISEVNPFDEKYSEYIEIKSIWNFSWELNFFWIWYWETQKRLKIELYSWNYLILAKSNKWFENQNIQIVSWFSLSNDWEYIKITNLENNILDNIYYTKTSYSQDQSLYFDVISWDTRIFSKIWNISPFFDEKIYDNYWLQPIQTLNNCSLKIQNSDVFYFWNSINLISELNWKELSNSNWEYSCIFDFLNKKIEQCNPTYERFEYSWIHKIWLKILKNNQLVCETYSYINYPKKLVSETNYFYYKDLYTKYKEKYLILSEKNKSELQNLSKKIDLSNKSFITSNIDISLYSWWIEIFSVVPNPIWKDKWEEIISFTKKNEKIYNLDWFYIQNWKKIVYLSWDFSWDNILVLKWDFWLKNSTNCINIKFNWYDIDQMCYWKTKDWEIIYKNPKTFSWTIFTNQTLNLKEYFENFEIKKKWDKYCISIENKNIVCKNYYFEKLFNKITENKIKIYAKEIKSLNSQIKKNKKNINKSAQKIDKLNKQKDKLKKWHIDLKQSIKTLKSENWKKLNELKIKNKEKLIKINKKNISKIEKLNQKISNYKNKILQNKLDNKSKIEDLNSQIKLQNIFIKITIEKLKNNRYHIYNEDFKDFYSSLKFVQRLKKQKFSIANYKKNLKSFIVNLFSNLEDYSNLHINNLAKLYKG